jgi:DNA-binding response OmpR family regulator
MNRPIPEATIMIIDDEPENLRLLAGMLKRQNWMIRSFPSGPAALASAEAELPDLVLLDIRMPGMDGFEVCAGFKKNEQLRGIPVIFLSAVEDGEAKVRAFQMGGADYIAKPFHHDEVLARIRIQLAITHYRRELERLNLDLEDRVRQRTADLADANRQLTVEMSERQAAETALRASEERYRRIVTTAASADRSSC